MDLGITNIYQLDVVSYTCNPSTQRWKEEGGKFKASMEPAWITYQDPVSSRQTEKKLPWYLLSASHRAIFINMYIIFSRMRHLVDFTLEMKTTKLREVNVVTQLRWEVGPKPRQLSFSIGVLSHCAIQPIKPSNN